MGRKPVPTELKKLRGNPGKRKIDENEPVPIKMEGALPPPSNLGEDGKKAWKNISSELMRLGLLSCLDEKALMLYCDAYDQYMIADREVKEHFKNENSYLVLYVNKGGGENYIPHPGLKLKREAAELMIKIGSEFGFTPSSRTKLKSMPDEKEKDPFISFMQGRDLKKGNYLDA